MQQFAAWSTLVYGLLVLFGGVIGYLKAKSRPSLIAGSVFGITLVVLAVVALLGAHQKVPAFSAAVAGVLLVLFGFRYWRSKKLMPAGLLTVLSLVALLVNVFALALQKSP